MVRYRRCESMHAPASVGGNAAGSQSADVPSTEKSPYTVFIVSVARARSACISGEHVSFGAALPTHSARNTVQVGSLVNCSAILT